MHLAIRTLERERIPAMVRAFQRIRWDKPVHLFESYLAEQEDGRRVVLVALADSRFAGYLTVAWKPDYPPFRRRAVPEIQDFNVLPDYRRQGIGTRLMDEAEAIVAARSPVVGIGVGVYAAYGPAQRLYVRRGYVPDGRGLASHQRSVRPGDEVLVDDGLVLYLTKELRPDPEGA